MAKVKGHKEHRMHIVLYESGSLECGLIDRLKILQHSKVLHEHQRRIAAIGYIVYTIFSKVGRQLPDIVPQAICKRDNLPEFGTPFRINSYRGQFAPVEDKYWIYVRSLETRTSRRNLMREFLLLGAWFEGLADQPGLSEEDLLREFDGNGVVAVDEALTRVVSASHTEAIVRATDERPSQNDGMREKLGGLMPQY